MLRLNLYTFFCPNTLCRACRAKVTEFGLRHSICGRGRCAREGLNCTLTGTPQNVRKFCMALRAWKPALFGSTDFKIDDTLGPADAFKVLQIRKVQELVAYKLGGGGDGSLGSLARNAGNHVEADEFHQMLEEKEKPTVVLDVRNVYESTIGHFQPAAGSSVDFCPIPMQVMGHQGG